MLATSCGAMQLVLIGMSIRHGWNSEYFPHLSRLSSEHMDTTIYYAGLRW